MDALSKSMHFYKVTELDLTNNKRVTAEGYRKIANSDYAVNIEKILAANSNLND